eukprot:jgi/Botrbrau1/6207/Bobra.0109s0003.2
MQICGIFIKFYLLQRVSFGERDWRSRLDSSRRWSVISPSLHGSPIVVCSFWMDGFAVLTSWNLQEFCWIVMHSVGFKGAELSWLMAQLVQLSLKNNHDAREET